MTTTQTVSHAKPKTPKKTKPSAADQVAKMRQTVLAIAPQPAPSELVMMPLTLIETRAQVRTEFDEETLAELAADIAARGVLQPILLRPNPGQVNFVVIAGERRLRAARLAQLDSIPAIIGEIDNDAAAAMQIAENIQREDLSLADTAKAVRKLYELNGNSVTVTAEKLHKSKGWVSKRLTASCPDLRYQAKEILEGGFSEDLEIILTLDKLQALDWYACQQLCEAIKKGEAGRQTVREAYDEAKAVAERRDAEYAARNTPEQNAQRKLETEQQNQKWQEEAELRKKQARLDPMQLRWQYDEELEEDQRDVLEKHLMQLYTSGSKAVNHELVRALVRMNTGNYSNIEIAAFAAGNQGVKFGMGFDLAELIELTITANSEEDA